MPFDWATRPKLEKAFSESMQARPKYSVSTLSQGEHFFIDLLDALTNSASLDSHRVPCLNANLVMGELLHELEMQLVSQEELILLGKEARALVDNDPVWKDMTETSWDRVKPALEAICNLKGEIKKSDLFAKPEIKALIYALRDVLPRSALSYAKQVAGHLKSAIQANTLEAIELALRTFLSQLMHHGWSLAALHGWKGYFRNKRLSYTFDERFNFWAERVLAAPQDFLVILRLSGSRDLQTLQKFGGFSFHTQVEAAAKVPASFSNINAQTTFANTIVQAVDFDSAAHEAVKQFEKCLDRIRFNFSSTAIKMDSQSLVIRQGDSKVSLERIEHLTPNPRFQLPPELFVKASQDIDALLDNPRIDRATKECVISAGRQYRMGQDSETYRDKFLNWWMGLEFLVRTQDQQGIGRTVVKHAGNTLMLRYLYWLITDLQARTFSALKTWPDSVAALVGRAANNRLRDAVFISVLRDPAASQSLLAALGDFPVLQRRTQMLSEALRDNKKTLQLLRRHRERLEWHLQRLYRQRCCIVHGTPLFLTLALPAANLEFYLREVLVVALQTLDGNGHICSLAEVFDRSAYSWNHVVNTLEKAEDPVPPQILIPSLTL